MLSRCDYAACGTVGSAGAAAEVEGETGVVPITCTTGVGVGAGVGAGTGVGVGTGFFLPRGTPGFALICFAMCHAARRSVRPLSCFTTSALNTLTTLRAVVV